MSVDSSLLSSLIDSAALDIRTLSVLQDRLIMRSTGVKWSLKQWLRHVGREQWLEDYPYNGFFGCGYVEVFGIDTLKAGTYYTLGLAITTLSVDVMISESKNGPWVKVRSRPEWAPLV